LSVRHSADGGLDVACTIRNTGKRTADEVVQVYLGAPANPPAGAAFAVHALADFARVTVRPDTTQRVHLHIVPERLRYWSNADAAWHGVAGARTIYVGASSRDLRLSQRVAGPDSG
jgi:beta-glucosidase